MYAQAIAARRRPRADDHPVAQTVRLVETQMHLWGSWMGAAVRSLSELL